MTYKRFVAEPLERAIWAIRVLPENLQELYEAGWVDGIYNDFGTYVGEVVSHIEGDGYLPPTESKIKVMPGSWIIMEDGKRKVMSNLQMSKEWELTDVNDVTADEDEALRSHMVGHDPATAIPFKPQPRRWDQAEPGHTTGKGKIDTDDPQAPQSGLPLDADPDLELKLEAAINARKDRLTEEAKGAETSSEDADVSVPTPGEFKQHPDPDRIPINPRTGEEAEIEPVEPAKTDDPAVGQTESETTYDDDDEV